MQIAKKFLLPTIMAASSRLCFPAEILRAISLHYCIYVLSSAIQVRIELCLSLILRVSKWSNLPIRNVLFTLGFVYFRSVQHTSFFSPGRVSIVSCLHACRSARFVGTQRNSLSKVNPPPSRASRSTSASFRPLSRMHPDCYVYTTSCAEV
ncbi:hypothetical protein DL96DRAFT_20975 [Flagelloscypha sp. PMI_526]|nr:hypothetical protein DL96DRAFT_20975 [Flagelloscypha sp. PMI_526]